MLQDVTRRAGRHVSDHHERHCATVAVPAMSQRESASPRAATAGPNQAANALGSLIDADLAMEAAQLTALRNRQALGDEEPACASPTPQTLRSLFSHA
jgi:hypothetical protein